MASVLLPAALIEKESQETTPALPAKPITGMSRTFKKLYFDYSEDIWEYDILLQMARAVGDAPTRATRQGLLKLFKLSHFLGTLKCIVSLLAQS